MTVEMMTGELITAGDLRVPWWLACYTSWYRSPCRMWRRLRHRETRQSASPARCEPTVSLQHAHRAHGVRTPHRGDSDSMERGVITEATVIMRTNTRTGMYIVTTIATCTSAQRMLCYTPRLPSNNQHIEATSFHVGHATIGCLWALYIHVTPTSRRVSMFVLDCYVRALLTQYLNVTQSYKRWGAVNTRIMCCLCCYLVHLMANKSHVSRNSRPLRDITPTP